MSVHRDHVAIVHRQYMDPIVRGHKTIECRLSKSRMAPFGRVGLNDTLHFKQSGGPFFARATVSRVLFVSLEGPGGIERLRDEHDAHIMGDAEYWASKRHAKYASLLWFTRVREVSEGPDYPRGSRLAWHVMG